MKENRMKDVLESIGQRDVPDNVNIWPRVAEKLERKSFMQTVRTQPVFALFIVLLALVFISSAAYAIGKVTGYIPGVGFVNQTMPVRILAKPVKVKQAGITVMIRRMVTDADHTFVIYRVDGLPLPTTPDHALCNAMPFLQLPDGSILNLLSGGRGPIGGEMGLPMRFEATIYYPPIPMDIHQVMFTFPCILPEGAGPQNWQIPLNLSPAPEGYVLPALEIGATFVASTPSFATTPTPRVETNFTPAPSGSSLPITLTPVSNGSGLYLERVIELDSSFLLIGNFTDTGDLPGSLFSGSVQQSVPYEFRVTDRNGKPISFSFRPDLMPPSDLPNVTYWALEIRKPLDEPVVIALPQIVTTRDQSFLFRIDAGANPIVGQSWTLNQTVNVGDYSFLVESITYAEHGYSLKVRSPLSREKVFLELRSESYIAQALRERFHEGNGYTDFSETLIFKDEPPTGTLTFTLHIYVDSPIGPWTLTWTPPSK